MHPGLCHLVACLRLLLTGWLSLPAADSGDILAYVFKSRSALVFADWPPWLLVSALQWLLFGE